MKIKISNMTTSGGNFAPNQFIIETEAGKYFQSYDSVIAFIPKDTGGPIVLGPDWDYSNTTRRYLYQFLPYGYDKKGDILVGLNRKELIEGDLDLTPPNKEKFKRADIQKAVSSIESENISFDDLFKQLKALGGELCKF